MTYDKYRDWPLPSRSGNIFSVMQGSRIEEQVLKDLSDAKDEIDKLEILDSFAAYTQRAYRQELAEIASIVGGQQLGALLEPILLSRLPVVTPTHRGRPAPASDNVSE